MSTLINVLLVRICRMNNYKYVCLILFAVILSSGCVTNKQYTFFQKDDLYNQTVVEDSIYSVYDLPSFEYRLQSYDILSIKIFSLTDEEFDFFKKDPTAERSNQIQSEAGQLINGYLVDQNGYITLPVEGKVKLAGLSISEAEDHLREIADNYLDEPLIEVKLLNYRFTVHGEVNQPGTISTYNYAVSIPEALGLAGGLGDLADKDNIKIIRRINNKNVVFYINLLEEDFFGNEQYYVHSNDIIIVPPLKQRPFRKYFTQNLSVFNSSVSVILVGLNLYFLLSSDR